MLRNGALSRCMCVCLFIKKKYLSNCVELESTVLVQIVLLVTFSTTQSTEGVMDSIVVVVIGSTDVLGGTCVAVALVEINLVVSTVIGASSIGDVSLALNSMLSAAGIYRSVCFTYSLISRYMPCA